MELVELTVFKLTVHFKHEMIGMWQKFQRNLSGTVFELTVPDLYQRYHMSSNRHIPRFPDRMVKKILLDLLPLRTHLSSLVCGSRYMLTGGKEYVRSVTISRNVSVAR